MAHSGHRHSPRPDMGKGNLMLCYPQNSYLGVSHHSPCPNIGEEQYIMASLSIVNLSSSFKSSCPNIESYITGSRFLTGGGDFVLRHLHFHALSYDVSSNSLSTDRHALFS